MERASSIHIFDMTQFVCSQCNYKFSSFRKPLNCPYCGKKNTVNPEATVNDLLRDVDAMLADGKL